MVCALQNEEYVSSTHEFILVKDVDRDSKGSLAHKMQSRLGVKE